MLPRVVLLVRMRGPSAAAWVWLHMRCEGSPPHFLFPVSGIGTSWPGLTTFNSFKLHILVMHPCHVTVARAILVMHPCHVTVARAILVMHPCHVTVARAILVMHPCHVTVVRAILVMHPCHVTVARAILYVTVARLY